MTTDPGPTAALTYSAIEALLPVGWELEAETEGGQPNGRGEIEDSGYREWFTPERETHQVNEHYGWRARQAERQAREST